VEARLNDTRTSPLDRLFQLQEVSVELHRKTERRDRTPDHLIHVEAAYRDARRLRDDAVATLATAEARKRSLDSDIADLSEKVKKYQQQLQAVKTNREYGALLNEIDGLKREIRAKEDEVLSLEETIASSRGELRQREAAFPAEEEDYEAQMVGWRAEQATLNAEIERAQKKADELRAGLDRRLLHTFERIAKVRAGIAVARVAMVGPQTATCSACHLRLRPQLLSDLRLSKDTILCEGCKRILYWDGQQP
jgi:predicted  nucleic acid-binding Zn-ribbon protein